MTIASETRKAGPYAGNGATVAFAFAFKVFEDTDLRVVLTSESDEEEDLTITSQYTVSLNADQDANPGGTVTLLTAPATGETVTIASDVPYLQETDIRNAGRFYPSVLEDALDRALIQLQQVREVVNRALRLPISDGTAVDLPVATSRALKMLGFDGNGDPTVLTIPTDDTAAYTQLGTGAVERPVETRLREVVSVKDFGATGDGVTDDYAAILAAWEYCRPNGKNLYFPAGTYNTYAVSFPFRQTVASSAVTSLLECNNMTVYGDGPATILKTQTVAEGADVLQLNGLKNFHVRDLKITSARSGAGTEGTNGVSITGGYDNITVLDVDFENLPSVDNTTYVDGGRALTVQCNSPPNTSTTWGRLVARIRAKGCSDGFDYEPDLDDIVNKRASVDVHLVAEDCYRAVAVVSGAASAAVPEGICSGVRVRGQAVNCQLDVVLARAHGVDIEMQVVTSKSEAARRLDPNGVAWYAAGSNVIALTCIYAKNARVVLTGYKGTCAYKAHIGGTTAGSSGLSGATEFCDFYIDLGGTAATAITEAVEGSDTMSNSRLVYTSATGTSHPADFDGAAKDNVITHIGA